MKIIEEETSILSDQDAAKADAVLAEAAGSLTFGKLRAAAQRLVLDLDPESAQRRKQTAKQDAHIRKFREDSGNAGMVARELHRMRSSHPGSTWSSGRWTCAPPASPAPCRSCASAPIAISSRNATAALPRPSRTAPGRPRPLARMTSASPSARTTTATARTETTAAAALADPAAVARADPATNPLAVRAEAAAPANPAVTPGPPSPRWSTSPCRAALTGQSVTPADVAGRAGGGRRRPRPGRGSRRDPRSRWCVTALHSVAPPPPAAARAADVPRRPAPAASPPPADPGQTRPARGTGSAGCASRWPRSPAAPAATTTPRPATAEPQTPAPHPHPQCPVHRAGLRRPRPDATWTTPSPGTRAV